MTPILAREPRPRADVQTGSHWNALSNASGLDLHAYRADHIAGRIDRAMGREGVACVDELARLVRRDAAARDRFRRAVAISVTGRFRDPQQFDLLRGEIVPSLLRRDGSLRVWSAGCSNGLEIYSLATLIDELGGLSRSRLIGTDVLEENVALARRGGGDGMQPSAAIAARVRFEVRDLMKGGAPDGTFGLILCRNVGIYFAPPARSALMSKLAGALAPGGVLMLGRSERLIEPRTFGLEPSGPHAYRRPA